MKTPATTERPKCEHASTWAIDTPDGDGDRDSLALACDGCLVAVLDSLGHQQFLLNRLVQRESSGSPDTPATGPMNAPTTSGFPWSNRWPSWLTWTADDGRDWEVTLGDHDTSFIPTASGDDEQAITVSAGPHAGGRWFIVDDPRGLAAALIAAADAADGDCWRCDHLGEPCARHPAAGRDR